VISKCERDRHVENTATEESASVICEILWHSGASERKRVAPRSEKSFMGFKKRFEKQTTELYWSKTADYTETFLFFPSV
jgi:hypothetical protein